MQRKEAGTEKVKEAEKKERSRGVLGENRRERGKI